MDGLLLIASKIARDEELSGNLLKRLGGFIDEVQKLAQEIMDNSGQGSVWADRKEGRSEVVKSAVDQLQHLAKEFQSLSGYIEKKYHDKNITKTIAALVESLNSLSKAAGGTVGRLLGGKEKFIKALQERDEEVQTRIRACRNALKVLQERSGSPPALEDDPLKDFDFGPAE